MKIVEKAYEIDLSKIEEGYLYDNMIEYGKTRGQAKSRLMSLASYENIALKYSNDPVTFINIPIKRCRHADKLSIDGEVMQLWKYNQIIARKARIAELEQMKLDHEYAYIMKRGTYYLPGSCGYTDYKSRAGVYTIEKAVQSAIGCEEITIVPINIEEHNKMIQSSIDDLTKNIIK